jgi:DNA-binding HxlR family transcriptional regulator
LPFGETEWKVLVALHRSGPAPIMSLRESASLGGNAVQNGVRNLQGLGLVSEERENKPPFRRTISLTIFGKKTAALLDQAEEYIRQAQPRARS